MDRTNPPQKELRLSFLPIGKSDCFLIEVPEDGFYLCDTGTREDAPAIKRVLQSKGVTNLRAVFLTHGHKVTFFHQGNAGHADMLGHRHYQHIRFLERLDFKVFCQLFILFGMDSSKKGEGHSNHLS